MGANEGTAEDTTKQLQKRKGPWPGGTLKRKNPKGTQIWKNYKE